MIEPICHYCKFKKDEIITMSSGKAVIVMNCNCFEKLCILAIDSCEGHYFEVKENADT